MQQVHGVEQHSGSDGPDQRYNPAASPVILSAFPHGSLDGEGDEQGKSLKNPNEWVVRLHQLTAL